MNDIVFKNLNEFCNQNYVSFDKIDPDVVESCSYAYEAITMSGTRNNENVLSFSRSNDDLFFSIRFGTEREEKPVFEDIIVSMINETEREFDISPFSSGLFAESTKRAKCYDIFNNGKGVTLVITYENAIQ